MKFKDCFDLCEKYYGGLSERDEFIYESTMNIRKDKLEAPSKNGKYRSRCFRSRKTREVLYRREATYIGSDVTKYEHPKSSN